MNEPNSRLTTKLTMLALAVLNERSLAEDLRGLAALATRNLTRSTGASIALVVDGQPSTVAATDHIAPELDLVQYSCHEGPCITALAGRSVRVAFLAHDERFPHFAIGAADQRILSVMSIPIVHNDQTIGTLNVYSQTANAFDESDHNAAQLVAAEAANAIARSQLLTSATSVREQLQADYDEQAVISSAQDVLMALQDCSEDQAIRLLQNASSRNEEPLVVIATRILESVHLEPRAERRSSSSADG
jgi:GAF domain-containing protein